MLGICAAAAVTAAPPASADTCVSRVMYIVAHEDDSLLFQSPDLLHDVLSGSCVSTVFVTAGDAGAGQAYWSGREDGARAAYADMAGVPDIWDQGVTQAGAHSIPTYTLSGLPSVRELFLRIPDGRPDGSGYSTNGNESLQKLWTGAIGNIHPVDGSTGYAAQELVDSLAALMTTLQPGTIRAQDYVGAPGDGDHSDHHFSAYFARAAQQRYTTPHTFTGYEDYGTAAQPQNVFGVDLTEKQAAFYSYAAHDSHVCQSATTCTGTPYGAWLLRQYTVGSEPGPTANLAPTASAGSDQIVAPGATVQLDGSASSDPNGDLLTYQWTQTAGPTVTLSSPISRSPTFRAPTTPTSLTFQLAVNDGHLTSPAGDEVTITVGAAPVAALEVSPYSGMPPHDVTVDASKSTDTPPNDIASYTFDFGDGSPTVTQPSSDATVDHRYASEGRFVVTVTVQDRRGMTDTASRPVLVGPNLVARAVSPRRILDTRTGNGAPQAKLGPGATLMLQVQGRGGLPGSGVLAAVMNLTVTSTTGSGYLTVWPTGSSRPATSNVNFTSGRTVANLVQARVGADGRVQIFNRAGTPVDVIADVTAWFGAQDAPTDDRGIYSPVSPYRAVDTRSAGGTLDPGEVRTLRVTGTAGAAGTPAAGVEAVVLDVVAVNPTRAGYLTIFPGDQARPGTSSVNFPAGATVANRVLVPVGADGTIKIYNHSGATQVVVDVNGWFTAPGGASTFGTLYGAGVPQRLADSRTGLGGLSRMGPATTQSLQVTGKSGVPSASSARPPAAVVLNVTAVSPTRSGFLTVYPGDLSTRPLASDLNFAAGEVVPNLVAVRLPADGTVRLYNHAGSTHVVVDVQGWYAGS